MKNYPKILNSFFLGLSLIALIFLISCNKTELPQVKINEITEITDTQASLSASIVDDGGSEIIQKGFIWNNTSSVDFDANIDFSENGTGDADFSLILENLEPETTYYVRAYATNEVGIVYSEIKSFTCAEDPSNIVPCDGCKTITDIDGNVYRTTQIGDLCWTVENLRTTKYNDNLDISQISDNNAWKNTNEGAFCYYDNNPENAEISGSLYNYYAVQTEKLCPEDWHVATDADWKYLEGFVDSENHVGNTIWDETSWRGYDAGTKLKAENGWIGTNGVNERGFTALPGGHRIGNMGAFERQNEWAMFWTDSKGDNQNYYRRHISGHDAGVARFGSNPNDGYSVRCVKN